MGKRHQGIIVALIKLNVNFKKISKKNKEKIKILRKCSIIVMNRGECLQNASCLQNGGGNTYLIECRGVNELHTNYLASSKPSRCVICF